MAEQKFAPHQAAQRPMPASQRAFFLPWPTRTEWLILACAAAILILTRLIAAHLFHVFDDAFITFRYGRNLAEGDGFVYNPGEWVLGTTTPAFALLAALWHWLGLPLPLTAIAANILCDCATLAIVGLAAPPSWRGRTTLLFGVLLAAIPSLGRISVGGMEMGLFIALSAAAAALHQQGRQTAALALAAASYNVRPEGVIMLGVLGVVSLWQLGLRAVWQPALTAAAVLALPVALTFAYYGQLVPHSITAKSQLAPTAWSVVLRDIFAADPFVLLLLPLALVGAVVAWRPWPLARTVAVWIAAYTLAYLVAGPKIWPWYGAPIYFGVAVLATAALVWLSGWLPWRMGQAAAVVAGVGPLLVWLTVWLQLGQSTITPGVYQPLAAWCAENLHPGDVIVAADIGAVGYFCPVPIIDLAALVTDDFPPYPSLGEVVARYKPRYLFLNRTEAVARVLAADERLAPYAAVFAAPAVPLEAIPFEQVDWVQGYVMFEQQP